ncbi:MAG: hypothetical protein ACYDGY_04925 [Acidimicrobiales bacterium]
MRELQLGDRHAWLKWLKWLKWSLPVADTHTHTYDMYSHARTLGSNEEALYSNEVE